MHDYLSDLNKSALRWFEAFAARSLVQQCANAMLHCYGRIGHARTNATSGSKHLHDGLEPSLASPEFHDLKEKTNETVMQIQRQLTQNDRKDQSTPLN